MSDLDAVLERLVTDPAFAHELSRNPTEALAGYQLSGEDLSTLLTQVSFDRGTGGLVEERISKSSMFGLLTTMSEGLTGIGDPNETPSIVDPNQAPGEEPGSGLASAGIIILDQPDSGVGNPNEAPSIGDPNTAPGVIDPNQSVGIHEVDEKPTESVGYHEVDEKPTESVGIHEVDEQPAPDDVSIHEVDQPAPDDPISLVGFNPQPDPPGSRG